MTSGISEFRERDTAPLSAFSLLVKPASADCNLNCRYCFYLDRSELYPGTRVHRMSDAVLDRMISTFMATRQSHYAFGWQGGEPTLMGLPFFQRVTELQQKYGRDGAVVANGLQTNGTLITDDLAEHLARYRFLLGVSLDGPDGLHDRFRLAADGRPSHAAVVQGIERLQRHRVEFNILTLVSRANVDAPEEVYAYLRDQGFLFHQYIECVEFDDRGRREPFAISGPEWGEFLCGVYDEWMRGDTRRVSVRLFDSVLAMLVDGVANVCQMGRDCRQYLVVEHNGDVYPCDFFVEKDLALGNVMTGTWETFLSSPQYAEFGARKRSWDSRCAECPYLQFCAGDCPKNRVGAARDPRRLSELCSGWKLFYGHALPGFRRLADEIRAEREERTRREATLFPPSSRVPQRGRNDPCPCGSGRKFKKCCGSA